MRIFGKINTELKKIPYKNARTDREFIENNTALVEQLQTLIDNNLTLIQRNTLLIGLCIILVVIGIIFF